MILNCFFRPVTVNSIVKARNVETTVSEERSDSNRNVKREREREREREFDIAASDLLTS
jgi:hypothetical protein